MNLTKPVVFVIDDDASIRKSIQRLLTAADYQTEAFESASAFLARSPHPAPTCVIVDVQMPGLNGLDFQEALIQRRREEQLIFISGNANIPMCVQVMKAGAVDFLPKPFKSRNLIACIERALDRSREHRQRAAERNEARALLDLLTPRELEVLQLVVQGLLNKQIGAELGMAEQTVKVHRGRVTQKLRAASAVELSQIVQRAGVSVPLKH